MMQGNIPKREKYTWPGELEKVEIKARDFSSLYFRFKSVMCPRASKWGTRETNKNITWVQRKAN